jgi:hypothetical protein
MEIADAELPRGGNPWGTVAVIGLVLVELWLIVKILF